MMSEGGKVNYIASYFFDTPVRLTDAGLIIDWNIKESREEPPTINYCMQCKFARDLETKLYTCDGDLEETIYCDKHGVFCRAMRHPCDWAAISAK